MLINVNNDAENPKWHLASRELTVENTSYCGAKCTMCPRDEYKAIRNWQHMPMDLFTRVIDEGATLGMDSLDLCGFGDPFMDPDYEEKLKYVKETYPRIRTYTSTTGHLLWERNLPWITKYFDTLKISNYGFSKESYEAVHKGVLDFDEVWENLNALLAIPRDQRPHVILSFLILPENEHELEAWREYWEPKADEVMVWRPHNYGGSEEAETLAYQAEARRGGDQARSCGRPVRGNPFVRANGDVSVCCFDFNHKLVVGNLLHESLLDILHGEKLGRVKSVHDQLAFTGCGLLCDGCDQIYDRSDALVYASDSSRKTNQPTTHVDHGHEFIEERRNIA